MRDLTSIAVINAGSSSIKPAKYDHDAPHSPAARADRRARNKTASPPLRRPSRRKRGLRPSLRSRLGRVSSKLRLASRYCTNAIVRILARSRRRPCRNSQFQANPAREAGTSSRQSRNDLRGRPHRLARGKLPHRRPPRFGRSSKARFRLAPEAHRRNQDTRRRDASRRCRSNLLLLLEPRRSSQGRRKTLWPTMLISFSSLSSLLSTRRLS